MHIQMYSPTERPYLSLFRFVPVGTHGVYMDVYGWDAEDAGTRASVMISGPVIHKGEVFLRGGVAGKDCHA